MITQTEELTPDKGVIRAYTVKPEADRRPKTKQKADDPQPRGDPLQRTHRLGPTYHRTALRNDLRASSSIRSTIKMQIK